MSYVPKYRDYMAKADARLDDLPIDLQELIEKFEQAKEAWEQGGKARSLLPVLVKSDACISAEIFSMFGTQSDNVNVDKVKMMALKAKALKLKWKLK